MKNALGAGTVERADRVENLRRGIGLSIQQANGLLDRRART